jgi:hypothetical protein
MEITTYFEQLVRPSGAGADTFHALTLPGDNDVRIAVDQQGRPAVLIRDIPGFPLSNFRLKYLELSVRRGCQIISDGKTRIEDFILILFRAADPALTQYFFSIISTFLTTLDSARSNVQREQAYNSLLEIFRSLNEEPLSTVQGLWSELFVISNSNNIPALVDAWHHTPSDRFDFTSGRERLEVKSSRILVRVHTFAAFQLIPDVDTRIIVASLFVIDSPTGKTLQQLADLINRSLNDPALRLKLERIIARTLGRGITQSIQARFDVQIAKNSLCFYNATDVPRIEAASIPARVYDVHFKSDLSIIRPINPKELYPLGVLYQSL